jgi:hypothetical protein
MAHAEMLDALVAGEGFERVAQITEMQVGAPVGIYVPRPGSDGSAGSAAERYVADLIARRPAERPTEVRELVPIIAVGELQGAVVMLGDGGGEAMEYLQVAATAAVAGVAMMNTREATGDDPDELMADLVAGKELRPGEVARRARAAGCDLSEGVAAICVATGKTPVGGLLATIAGEYPDALTGVHGERLYVLVGGSYDRLQQLNKRLGDQSQSGRSARYRDPDAAPLAIEEAEIVLAVTEESGRFVDSRPTLGTIRLIFRTFASDPEQMIQLVEGQVSRLVRYDEKRGGGLRETFWAYQEANCNMNLTAKVTYAHRQTVSNRLARIKELTGLDPTLSGERELLSLSLQAEYVVRHARPR